MPPAIEPSHERGKKDVFELNKPNTQPSSSRATSFRVRSPSSSRLVLRAHSESSRGNHEQLPLDTSSKASVSRRITKEKQSRRRSRLLSSLSPPLSCCYVEISPRERPDPLPGTLVYEMISHEHEEQKAKGEKKTASKSCFSYPRKTRFGGTEGVIPLSLFFSLQTTSTHPTTQTSSLFLFFFFFFFFLTTRSKLSS